MRSLKDTYLAFLDAYMARWREVVVLTPLTSNGCKRNQCRKPIHAQPPQLRIILK